MKTKISQSIKASQKKEVTIVGDDKSELKDKAELNDKSELKDKDNSQNKALETNISDISDLFSKAKVNLKDLFAKSKL